MTSSYKNKLSKTPKYKFSFESTEYSIFSFLSYALIGGFIPYPICYGYILTDGKKAVKLTPKMFRAVKAGHIKESELINYFKNAIDQRMTPSYPFIPVIQTMWLMILPLFIVTNAVVLGVTITNYINAQEPQIVSLTEVLDAELKNTMVQTQGMFVLDVGYADFDDGTYVIPLVDFKTDEVSEVAIIWVMGKKADFEKNGIDIDEFEASFDKCIEFSDEKSLLPEWQGEWTDEMFMEYAATCLWYPEVRFYGRLKKTYDLQDYDFTGSSDGSDLHELIRAYFTESDDYKEQVLVLKERNTSITPIVVGALATNITFGIVFGLIFLLGFLNTAKLYKNFKNDSINN